MIVECLPFAFASAFQPSDWALTVGERPQLEKKRYSSVKLKAQDMKLQKVWFNLFPIPTKFLWNAYRLSFFENWNCFSDLSARLCWGPLGIVARHLEVHQSILCSSWIGIVIRVVLSFCRSVVPYFFILLSQSLHLGAGSLLLAPWSCSRPSFEHGITSPGTCVPFWLYVGCISCCESQSHIYSPSFNTAGIQTHTFSRQVWFELHQRLPALLCSLFLASSPAWRARASLRSCKSVMIHWCSMFLHFASCFESLETVKCTLQSEGRYTFLWGDWRELVSVFRPVPAVSAVPAPAPDCCMSLPEALGP